MTHGRQHDDRLTKDRQAIEYHYDLSNEFYALFLDAEMVYTCAWYREGNFDLERAQKDKLELVCRKLDLESGQSMLDMGCGWGSLVIHAARYHEVEVLGVTLSPAQAAFAQERIQAEGLSKCCQVKCLDYREILPNQRFDKIAAIGIIEHIGRANFAAFFQQVHELLRPEGLFLNHGITRLRNWKRTPQWDFLLGNVFPNGDLTHISHLTETMEREGFEIRDVENLRPHYARTCATWTRRLQANATEAIALVGTRTYRTWLIYLAASAVAFEEGSVFLHQTVANKVGAKAAADTKERRLLYEHWPDPLDGDPE